MIQKRYEYLSKEGKVWSDWYDYEDDDTQLEELSKNIWQLKNKYKQEFRIKQ
jgi:hypothetical protein